MEYLNNSQVVAFGKLSFKDVNKSIFSLLPDMSLLVIKEFEDEYRAICIDLEIDSLGQTVQSACDKLTNVLRLYTLQEIDNFGNDSGAVQDILNTIRTAGKQKDVLFNMYFEAIHKYMLNENFENSKSKNDVPQNVSNFFLIEPMHYSFSEPAVVAQA